MENKNEYCLAVVELDYHPEVLRNTCRIMENTGWNLMIVTTETIWKQVNLYGKDLPINLQLFIIHKKTDLETLFHEEKSPLWNADIMLFNTIASNYKFFASVNFKIPTIVRIHNLNAYFKRMYENYEIKWTPFFLWKDFSHFFRNSIYRLDWYYRKKLLKKVDYFAFPDNKILSYAKQNLNNLSDKCIKLPFTYTTKDQSFQLSNEQNKDKITIGLIGKVDQRNRDYDMVLESFKILATNLEREKPDYKIRLVLLGKANTNYGKAVSQKLKALESPYLEVLTFPGFVPQEEFEKHIKKSSFFILPIRVKTRYTIYNEVYGETKISGGINDVITYKKPALIISEYALDDVLKPIMEPYKDAFEMATKIHHWCNTKAFENVKVDKALEQYMLENIRKTYLETFDSIIRNHNQRN
jgi:hypothetical protein